MINILGYTVGIGYRFVTIQACLDYYKSSKYSYSCPLIIKIKSNKIYRESITIEHNNIVLEGDVGNPVIQGNIKFNNYTNTEKSCIKFQNLKLFLQQATLLYNNTSELYLEKCELTEISKISINKITLINIPEYTLLIVTKYLEINDCKIYSDLQIASSKFILKIIISKN